MNEVETAPLIAILDYGIGNLRSAQKGFERVGAEVHLTSDRGLIAEAEVWCFLELGISVRVCVNLGRQSWMTLLVRSSNQEFRF